MQPNYMIRPMALTQAQAAMSRTGQNPNIFEAYQPYRTPSAIIPGVRSVVTEDRGKNIIISMDGQDARRKINIFWISVGVVFSLIMLYVAYAALADLPPFSNRGPAGGSNIPKPIHIDDPSTTTMTMLNYEPQVMTTQAGESKPTIHAPRVSIVKRDEVSITESTSYSYGIMQVHPDTFEPINQELTAWSEDKDLRENDKVRITVYPKNEGFTASLMRKNNSTGDINVLSVISLAPNMPRIFFDDL